MDNVITVSFMAEQRGLCEDLYRCKETRRVYIRQECDRDHVRWLTSSKWTGGYEADCHMKEGLVMRVVNGGDLAIFEEKLVEEDGVSGTWAVKKGPFSWEVINSFAERVTRKYDLQDYEEWKAWLIQDTEKCGYAGYPENWLFAMNDYGKPKKIAQLDYLGKAAFTVMCEEKHNICGKSWICYEVRDASMDTTLAICGYKFEKEAE